MTIPRVLAIIAVPVAMTLGVACSSGGDGKGTTNAQSGHVDTTKPAAPAVPVIEVSSVAPSGVAVGVSFSVTNSTGQEFRLQWDKLTLTYPDGVTRSAFHDPNQAPYEAISGMYGGGANFYYDQADPYASKFMSGHYVVKYDGKTLKEADL